METLSRLTQNSVFNGAVISVICAVLCSEILLRGIPAGHDYKNLYIFYDLFHDQLNDGEIYPRWLKDANNGFGGMNFFFYPALVHYCAYFIDVISFNTLSMPHLAAANAFILLCLSGFAFYFFACSVAPKPVALLGAILYVALPYHFFYEIYIRTSYSEFSSYIWIPLVFNFIDPKKLERGKNIVFLAFSYAFLVISHVPVALLTSIFVGLWCFYKLIKLGSYHERKQYFVSCCVAIFCGLGLSAFFVYPALTMMDYAYTDLLWREGANPFAWFLFPFHACTGEKHFCYGLFFIALTQCAIPAVIYFCFFRSKSESSIKTITFVFLCFNFLCLFLMTQASLHIWAFFTILQKVQFPWRLLVVQDFIFCATLVFIFSMIDSKTAHLKKISLFVFVLLGLSYIGNVSYGLPIGRNMYEEPHFDEELFQSFVRTKISTYEHVPKADNQSFSLMDFINLEAVPFTVVSVDTARVETIKHKSRHITLHVDSDEDFTLSLRQFCTDGWMVVRNNADISKDVNLRSIEPYGQIAMDLPKGSYDLEIILPAFVQEKIGWAISLISLLLLAGFWLYGYKKARN